MEKNIMSVGDIHGNEKWKNPIFGSIESYKEWRKAIDSDESDHQNLPNLYPSLYSMDKIIFVGDYVDSFTVHNLTMKRNLMDLIHLKKTFPDKIVLLVGNHDLQYIIEGQYCSGYRPEMKYDFGEIFSKNIDCFQLAYLHESVEDGFEKKTLWTHAGITQSWLSEFHKLISYPKFNFYEEFKGWENEPIDVILNRAWYYRLDFLFTVDSDSGGIDLYSGPLWVRPNRMNKDRLPFFDQVVGHTPMKSIKTEIFKFKNPNNESRQDTIYYIDCLDLGDGSVLVKTY